MDLDRHPKRAAERYQKGQQYQAHWDFFDPQLFKTQPEADRKMKGFFNRNIVGIQGPR